MAGAAVEETKMGDRWNAMTQPVSLEEYARQADQSVAEAAAQDNLWNFHDAHEGRRREEAGLLSADIGSGLLPPPSIATGRR